MELLPTSHKREQTGFTLVEMMVSVAIGLVVAGSALSFYTFSLASFSSMTNFSDMNRKDRYASDIISRDIRSATSVSNLTSSVLVLNEKNDSPVTYTYNSSNGTLTRFKTYNELLLTNIVPGSFSWTMYSRPSGTNTYATFPTTTTISAAKLLSVQWNCWRRVAGVETNSLGVTTAMVEMRNQ